MAICAECIHPQHQPDRLFRHRSSCITSANQQCIARSSSGAARAKSGCQSTEPKNFQAVCPRLSNLQSPFGCIFSFCIHAALAKSPCNARVLRLIKLAHALCRDLSKAILLIQLYFEKKGPSSKALWDIELKPPQCYSQMNLGVTLWWFQLNISRGLGARALFL